MFVILPVTSSWKSKICLEWSNVSQSNLISSPQLSRCSTTSPNSSSPRIFNDECVDPTSPIFTTRDDSIFSFMLLLMASKKRSHTSFRLSYSSWLFSPVVLRPLVRNSITSLVLMISELLSPDVTSTKIEFSH
ncbi:hypothetical protein OGAPHI_000383 [Ogataea philodendri]|uniref:Uncharacterized protein n=1 Tax=Ogataea philodendri TaxID=1378263 RepID=A0A9P8PG89_9ASCO|nr:uncharacterized protein OGAPHI_000383 [Ogataea philodendri]KAH3671678.1 hypothetical protein OGAPHI_000383 [Ogataea philodendri]